MTAVLMSQDQTAIRRRPRIWARLLHLCIHIRSFRQMTPITLGVAYHELMFRLLKLEITSLIMRLAELDFLIQIILQTKDQIYNSYKLAHLPFNPHPSWMTVQYPAAVGPYSPGVSRHRQLSMVENRIIDHKIYTYKVRW